MSASSLLFRHRSRGVEATSIRSIIGTSADPSADPSTLWPDSGPTAAWSNSASSPTSFRIRTPGPSRNALAPMLTPSTSRSNSFTLYSKCICRAARICGVSAVGYWLRVRPENTASTVLPDAPPGSSSSTSSLSRPCGLISTGSLNVTVNSIVSYKR